MTIIVFAPHPDDEVLGVGGTLAKYAEEGERTVVVVFSTGTASHPLHKEKLIVRTRKEETIEAHKILGVSETVFLDLEDIKLREEIIEKESLPKIFELIKKEKPHSIFIPALDDLHTDHRAVAHAIIQLHAMYGMKAAIYTYTIWNPLPLLKRSEPKLVVDVSKTHSKKVNAFGAYKSQWVSMYQLIPIVVTKAFFNGIRYGNRWSEVFIRIR